MISQEVVMDIARDTIWLIIKVSMPLLLVSLIIGLLVSIFQTVTSIQEQTLTFIPKIIGIFVGMLIFGGWILNSITTYMTELWSHFSYYLSGS
ncbi:flagellar biosynthesis protein FliQ [Anaerosacchariphilus polymeriproducens]|uniref:Flagellar biosynthetic protein FliQ n=1 Tax=Anaerosacchariphilus polymeriproducens TaxID=1812858 RepID=A0A371AS77_9FIRM|nr:flagellar biosynthesis protein FliQ [Anaerosacchariphilus polymeriproducens]RDU22419.1 flagellar biosynthetic protein FliQ [Anaerosacchariphilus polymeriproducens]